MLRSSIFCFRSHGNPWRKGSDPAEQDHSRPHRKRKKGATSKGGFIFLIHSVNSSPEQAKGFKFF